MSQWIATFNDENLGDLQTKMNKWLADNSNYKIMSVSHDVINLGNPMGNAQLMVTAIVVAEQTGEP